MRHRLTWNLHMTVRISICFSADLNLLPEILSYPFWELSRETIWGIAVEAEHSGYPRKQWLGVMRNSKDKKVSQIAQFFDGLAGKAQTETLETLPP